MKETTGWFAHLKAKHSDLHPHTQKDTTFDLIPNIVLFLSLQNVQGSIHQTQTSTGLYFSCLREVMLLSYFVLLLGSPSLPIFRKDLFPNNTND